MNVLHVLSYIQTFEVLVSMLFHCLSGIPSMSNSLDPDQAGHLFGPHVRHGRVHCHMRNISVKLF